MKKVAGKLILIGFSSLCLGALLLLAYSPYDRFLLLRDQAYYARVADGCEQLLGRGVTEGREEGRKMARDMDALPAVIRAIKPEVISVEKNSVALKDISGMASFMIIWSRNETNSNVWELYACSGGGLLQKLVYSRVRVWSIAEETLSAANRVGFDYLNTFRKSEQHDKDALAALLRFSLHTDAAASYGHGIVLARLVREWGDASFSKVAKEQSKEVRTAALRDLEAGLYSGPSTPNIPLREFSPETYSSLVQE